MSEVSFAALCGVSPVPATSGKTTRHRLNRGGDRLANSALYIIAIVRLRTDDKTKQYATLTDAILDRIVHNSHRMRLGGDSMRKRKAPTLLTGAEINEINHPNSNQAGGTRSNPLSATSLNGCPESPKSAAMAGAAVTAATLKIGGLTRGLTFHLFVLYAALS